MNTYYYYDNYSRDMQAVYHRLCEGLLAMEDEILLPRVPDNELIELFFRLRLDHPEIFWAESFKYKFYPDSPNLIFVPDYVFTKNKIREQQKAMAARLEKLVRPAAGLSDRDKELYIHDFICRNVRYDKLKKAYSHEILGPLGNGVGVCEGIAKTVKLLCDALGLWCMTAVCGSNPEKGIKYRHVWNVIRLDGAYYHLDATFDNSLTRGNPGEIRYDYFNLDDSALFRDHEPLIAPAPACENKEHFYYREKKLSFTKTEDLRRRLQQAAKKNKPLTFHWRGGYFTREAAMDILRLIGETGEAAGKKAKVSLNFPQAVVAVSYSPDTEGEIRWEEADESTREDAASPDA